MTHWSVLEGDCIESMREMPSGSVNTCVTSPPYFGLRDYGHAGQIGLEPTPEAFVARMVEVFREVHRVLRDDGTLWLNLGDSYNGSNRGAGGHVENTKEAYVPPTGTPPTRVPGLKPKDLIGIPWRVAFALQADGWYLRQDIIWHKPNPMPESVTDRCTKSHEYIFLLSKSQRYHFDSAAMQEPAVSAAGDTRNRRSVWTVATRPFEGAHFATFPPDLIEPCVLAGAPEGGMVLDPFAGSGTTGMVAMKHGRRFVGCELNPEYCAIARARIAASVDGIGLFANLSENSANPATI